MEMLFTVYSLHLFLCSLTTGFGKVRSCISDAVTVDLCARVSERLASAEREEKPNQ